jgi:hypothetical protein
MEEFFNEVRAHSFFPSKFPSIKGDLSLLCNVMSLVLTDFLSLIKGMFVLVFCYFFRLVFETFKTWMILRMRN